MAQTSTPKLDGGDPFPAMTIQIADGDPINLPDDLTSDYTIFLGYRGKW